MVLEHPFLTLSYMVIIPLPDSKHMNDDFYSLSSILLSFLPLLFMQGYYDSSRLGTSSDTALNEKKMFK